MSISDVATCTFRLDRRLLAGGWAEPLRMLSMLGSDISVDMSMRPVLRALAGVFLIGVPFRLLAVPPGFGVPDFGGRPRRFGVVADGPSSSLSPFSGTVVVVVVVFGLPRRRLAGVLVGEVKSRRATLSLLSASTVTRSFCGDS